MPFQFPPLGGMEIIVDEQMGRRRAQVRFPRSKRKRVRKKWRRDKRNWIAVYDGPQALLVRRHRALGPGLSSVGPFVIVNPEAKRMLDKELAVKKEIKEVSKRASRDTENLVMAAIMDDPDGGLWPGPNTFTTESRGQPRLCTSLGMLEDLERARLRIMDGIW